MSANLLAEIDGYYQPHGTGSPYSTSSAHREISSSSKTLSFDGCKLGSDHAQEACEDDDDFGDFQTSQASPSHRKEQSYDADTHHAIFHANVKTASGARSKPRDENVLFDADEELDEDDFGDFEVGDHSEQRQQHDIKRVNLSQGHAQSSQNQATILIDLEEQHMRGKETSTEGYPASFSTSTQKAPRRVLRFDQTFESDISEQKSIWPGNSTAAPSQVLQSDITQKDEDPWPESPDPSQEVESFSRVEDQNEAKALDRKASTSSSNMVKQLALPELLVAPDDLPASSPPTNIPPPVLLFGLFTPVFKLVQSKLFEPLSQHSSASPTRSSILSTDQTQRLLDSLLVVGVVLGHIIAGRKLRWKRDTILNQSMRIGPASASRSGGGMKLTSLDKGESAKEDRECAEAIAAWRSQAGRLRSAIGKESPMPEIGDTLPVRTAQAGEGAMASTKPCVLCGLKRHERVPTVDFNVQDSFGEWWVEHWGHRTCLSFWSAQQGNLKAR